LNVLLFMPLGYLIPLSFSKVDRWWQVLLIGFLFSLLIETVQLITRLGWFDASDLLHNTLGALIGYWIYCKWLREKTT
jgi:glycopeptide antibiotics resistance protein